MNASFRAAAALACLIVPFLAGAQSHPSPDAGFAQRLTPAELQRVYLACDAAATAARMPANAVMHCALVSQELQQRVFGGDFDKLLAWWRTHRRAADERVTTGAN